jgi:DNA-binding NarL/FixJ family response regulator
MTASSAGSGGDFLTKKSDVTKLRQELPALTDVLIVEDETIDADRLKATLRVMFGYDLEVRRAATLGNAVDSVVARKPDLVFLDDVLKPSDNATSTIPYLRGAKYEGPIVVVSGQVTRRRRDDLLAAGATDVIHKDDVDSVRLGEALLRVFKEQPGDDAGAATAAGSKPADAKKCPKIKGVKS